MDTSFFLKQNIIQKQTFVLYKYMANKDICQKQIEPLECLNYYSIKELI